MLNHRTGLLAIVLVLAVVFASPPGVAAPATDLLSNTSPGTGAGVNASTFEVAERFTVPAGQTWRVTGVNTDGFANPGKRHTVTFYASQGGLPGVTICQRTNAEAIGTFVASVSRVQDPELRLENPCVLGAGDYYVGLQATSSLGGSMQINTSATLIGAQSVIRGGSCGTNFLPISTCFTVLSPQELQFRIRGCQAASCEFAAQIVARCAGSNLQLEVRDGDLPILIEGNGPNLPRSLVSYGLNSVPGPGLWQSLTATEQAGDLQQLSLASLNCGPRTVSLVESGGSTEVDEAQPAVPDSYTLVLDSSPDAGETVTIGFSSDTLLGVSTSPFSVAFDSSNWSQAQTITVTAVDDTVLEAPVHQDTIRHALFSTGGVFSGTVAVPDVTVDILDDEVPMTGLEVIVVGAPFADVISLPDGIACPGACSVMFELGSTVELVAGTVNNGQFFSWGGACSGQADCILVMDGPQRVIATFGDPDALRVDGFE
jgi:hypothetical protein